MRRCGVSSASTATRASSWRKRTASPSVTSSPASTSSSTSGPSSPALASSDGSIRPPSRAITSSADRAAGLTCRALASTASRADRGRSVEPAASSSVRKNALPPVRRWSVPGSRPDGPARSRTPSSDSGRTSRRCVAGCRAQLADRLAPRVVAGDSIVAERQDDEAPQAADTAGDEAQEVQRGVVGPVHVLDEEHREVRSVEEVEQRGELLGTCGAAATRRGERATDLRGDVEQRPQRTGRELAVAGPDEPLGVRELGLQRVDERRLADARFTSDEHHPTRPGAGPARGVEQRPVRLLSLDEPHRLESATRDRGDPRT